MFRHLLVPTDGSPLSDEAVTRAVSFARETGARITFFFASRDVDASVYGEAALLRSLDPILLNRAMEEEARAILNRCLEAARAAGVSAASATTVADEPFEAIIATALERGCDLILMASHGRRGVKGLLLGSQTQKVLTHSRIPVLVYR